MFLSCSHSSQNVILTQLFPCTLHFFYLYLVGNPHHDKHTFCKEIIHLPNPGHHEMPIATVFRSGTAIIDEGSTNNGLDISQFVVQGSYSIVIVVWGEEKLAGAETFLQAVLAYDAKLAMRRGY